MRAFIACCAVVLAAQHAFLHAQEADQRQLTLLDVPYLSQSELLCGGAAAAMVLRYWGERGITAESFSSLVDRSAAGIRTDVLIADLERRGWLATGIEGTDAAMRRELAAGRPVLTLIEDRPSTFHYIVVLATHARGVVFHDPARAPFLVMSSAEFDRRWRVAGRWMGIVLPSASPSPPALSSSGTVGVGSVSPAAGTPCERLVADGVRLAQEGKLDAAEQLLASAIGCPASLRELAGVRALQKRWAEASDLASAATDADGQDVYAWKLLATSRFVQSDRTGALEAWNHIGEPRLDIVRIDGLTRTRHRAVEHVIGIDAGDVLTLSRFERAQRRLSELPAARTTRLDYVPVPSGLAELRGAIAERPILPTNPVSLGAMGISAGATREVRLVTGSLTGAGEQVSATWRFWPRRPYIALGIASPAPWGGVWNVLSFSGRQPFSSVDRAAAERSGARLGFADWVTSSLRWNVAAGVDRWKNVTTRSTVGGGIRYVALRDRLESRFGVDAWPGTGGFATADASLRVRSSTARRGNVVAASAALQRASHETPLDLWWAGDTGSVRASLLRAHPLLSHGRLRTDRLGRTLFQGSVEAQRWWQPVGPVSTAFASFVDLARTAQRVDGVAVHDVDVGVGARLSVTGVPGLLRVDVAAGLRDGRKAVSFVYEP
ncbi:MAG: hypothetical protein HOP16_04120 [Acidobacteria bacterium]|nr:hypothetical protein [Acidobacteriota bacterium]